MTSPGIKPIPKEIKASVTPDTLARWLGKMISQGMSAVTLRRSAGDEPVGALQVKSQESFSAPSFANEIMSYLKDDAEMRGGKVLYRINACSEEGVTIGESLIQFETGAPSIDPTEGLNPRDAHLARGYEGLLSGHIRLEQMLIQAYEKQDARIGQLQDKVVNQLEAVEKALTSENDRAIARAESEAKMRRDEKAFGAIVETVAKYGPVIAAKKLGMDEKLIRSMMGSMFSGDAAKSEKPKEGEAKAENAYGKRSDASEAPAEKTIPFILSKIPEIALCEFIMGLSQEQQIKLFSLVPEEYKKDVFERIDKLSS